MPFQPPTRPHSTHPNPSLPTTILAHTNAGSQPNLLRGSSMSSFTTPRETDWEDAWDSSSDREDNESIGKSSVDLAKSSPAVGPGRSTNSTTDPIPIRNGPGREASTSVSGSWASSFQHVSHPSSSSPHRAVPTKPSTSKSSPSAIGSSLVPTPTMPMSVLPDVGGKSKLPPGGAWEIVEPSEVIEPVPVEVKKVGKEALREDIEDILRG